MTPDEPRPRLYKDPETGDRRDPAGGRTHDRRRGGWRDFRRAYPGFVFTLLIGLISMIAISGALYLERRSYGEEIARLRAGMSAQERAKTDAIVEAEEHKVRIALALARWQARLEKRLHLSVAVDSGKMYLEREGAVLREIAAVLGPEGKVGPDSIPVAVPRGERSITSVDSDGIALDGGTRITATDATSLAEDMTPLPPGSVRIRRADLRAITPNLAPGMSVYFY